MYCLMPNMYMDWKRMTSLNDLNGCDLVQSKILICKINGNNHDRLNYRNIMHKIYGIIGNRKKIKKTTQLNIEFGEYTEKGYKYIEDLDMSIQGTDAKLTLREIVNQCTTYKIKLEMKIMLNNAMLVELKI